MDNPGDPAKHAIFAEAAGVALARGGGKWRANHLGKLRLLIALDALLVAGSVNGAAREMQLSVPAMSRLLGQIRAEIGDPIFVRAGRQLVPTPRAEAMRMSLRRLVSDVERVFDGPGEAPATQPWTRPEATVDLGFSQAPPLSLRPSTLLEGQPTPVQFATVLAGLADASDPRQRLARYIALIGRGVGHSRPLSMDEAEEAFSIILAGQADPYQIGAFLQVMHYRRETAAELAGLVRATRRHFGLATVPSPGADLDWPVYLAQLFRRPPWFLQSARLVADAGYRVLLHGADGGVADPAIDLATQTLGFSVSTSLAAARSAVHARGIAFLRLDDFASQLPRLLAMYPLVQSRSPVHSIRHMLNPLGATASLLGVARTAYFGLHRDVAQVLDWPRVSVLASARDVAELNPFKAAKVYRWADGAADDMSLAGVPSVRSPVRAHFSALEHWQAVWRGNERDVRAQKTIVNTAAVALMTIRGEGASAYPAAQEEALALWSRRHEARAPTA